MDEFWKRVCDRWVADGIENPAKLVAVLKGGVSAEMSGLSMNEPMAALQYAREMLEVYYTAVCRVLEAHGEKVCDDSE